MWAVSKLYAMQDRVEVHDSTTCFAWQARRGVDDAHLNAKVIQLDLANMAASPPHSPSEKVGATIPHL